jgi:hypothetical protein
MLPSPEQIAISPCCRAALLEIAFEALTFTHYQCRECKRLFTWNGRALCPCEERFHALMIFARAPELGRPLTVGPATTKAGASRIVQRLAREFKRRSQCYRHLHPTGGHNT